MISISEYLNEKPGEYIFELKGETYLNAAKKAKKLGDPRAEKFLQAFKDNIDKELMDEGPDDEEKKFNIYYNADKKSIVRLKALAKNWRGGAILRDLSRGTALEIQMMIWNSSLMFMLHPIKVEIDKSSYVNLSYQKVIGERYQINSVE